MSAKQRYRIDRFLHRDETTTTIARANQFVDAVSVCDQDYGAPVGEGIWFDLLPPLRRNYPQHTHRGYVINLPDRNYAIIEEES